MAINSVRMLGVDEEKVNVNGGAIALGHPIGASGARIVGALLHELRRRGGGIGCAAICSGGGQGDAIVLEVNGACFPRSVGRIAAFFDLDRTLMAGSSGMHFARAAYRSGMVSRARLARWGAEHIRFRLRGSTDARTAQVLSQVKELLAGVPERDIQRMGPDLLAGVLPRIYPKMLEEVRAHQDAGRATFIVSAAGNGLVELLAGVLGMDGGIGTRYEVDGQGVLTGQIVERTSSTARARWSPCSASPPTIRSTCPSLGPTPIPPRTCRCCGRSATRSP